MEKEFPDLNQERDPNMARDPYPMHSDLLQKLNPTRSLLFPFENDLFMRVSWKMNVEFHQDSDLTVFTFQLILQHPQST